MKIATIIAIWFVCTLLFMRFCVIALHRWAVRQAWREWERENKTTPPE